MQINLEAFGNTTQLAVLLAGDHLRHGFGQKLEIETKTSATDFVTNFDKETEELIINFIRSRHPNSSFIAEESGHTVETAAEVTWVIDPLDGTTNFIHNIPLYATTIACYLNGDVVAAASFLPEQRELFTAIRGKGAFLNGKRMAVSMCDKIEMGIFSTGFPYDLPQNPIPRLKPINETLSKGARIRDLGSAVISLAYVAAGRLDGWFMESPSSWDVAAGLLFCEEANGKITRMDGSPLNVLEPTDVLASNGHLHNPLINILTG